MDTRYARGNFHGGERLELGGKKSKFPSNSESCDVCKEHTLRGPPSRGDHGLFWGSSGRGLVISSCITDSDVLGHHWALDLCSCSKCLKATLPVKFRSLVNLFESFLTPPHQAQGCHCCCSGTYFWHALWHSPWWLFSTGRGTSEATLPRLTPWVSIEL